MVNQTHLKTLTELVVKRVEIQIPNGYTNLTGNLLASNIPIAKLDSMLKFYAIVELDSLYCFWNNEDLTIQTIVVEQNQIKEI